MGATRIFEDWGVQILRQPHFRKLPMPGRKSQQKPSFFSRSFELRPEWRPEKTGKDLPNTQIESWMQDACLNVAGCSLGLTFYAALIFEPSKIGNCGGGANTACLTECHMSNQQNSIPCLLFWQRHIDTQSIFGVVNCCHFPKRASPDKFRSRRGQENIQKMGFSSAVEVSAYMTQLPWSSLNRNTRVQIWVLLRSTLLPRGLHLYSSAGTLLSTWTMKAAFLTMSKFSKAL